MANEHEHDHRLHEIVLSKLMDGKYRQEVEPDEDDEYGHIKYMMSAEIKAIAKQMHRLTFPSGTLKVFAFEFSCGFTGAMVLVVEDKGKCKTQMGI